MGVGTDIARWAPPGRADVGTPKLPSITYSDCNLPSNGQLRPMSFLVDRDFPVQGTQVVRVGKGLPRDEAAAFPTRSSAKPGSGVGSICDTNQTTVQTDLCLN